MFKNGIIAILTLTTAFGAFAAYRETEKSIVLGVLLDEKSKTVTALESDKSALTATSAALQAKVDAYSAAEKQREEAAAALNAATVSDADTTQFGEPCRMWIAQNFGNTDMPSVTLLETTISDSWVKKGMLVFEIATPSTTGTTSSMFLCVVDKQKGSMFKPSAFETADWRRDN